MSEVAHQKALIAWFDMRYPRLAPLFWHTPNGGMRNKVEAFKLKQQGVRPGVPDLFLAVPRGTSCGLFIEMKSENGRLSPKQNWYLGELDDRGYAVACCYGWLEARDVVEGYLNGHSD